MTGRRLAPLLCAAALLGQMIVPAVSPAEWYVAGYGGISTEGLLRNVGLPTLGDARARADAATYFTEAVFSTSPLNRTDQRLDATDLSLKDSAMFGAKGGYYFNDYGYSWLGLELEAFTTQPNVKRQTFTTTQTILHTGPAGPIPGSGDPPFVKTINRTESIEESRLRVTTVAANLMLRHPGKFLEPYAGVGVGAFHFLGSGAINGATVVPGLNVLAGIKWHAGEHLTLFAEYKYNRATFEGLGTTLGLGANYEITHVVGGVGWHF